MDHRPERVERTDHHEQRRAEDDGPRERSDREQVDGKAPLRSHGALGDVYASHERQEHGGGNGDDDERRRDAERPHEERRDRRTECESEHVGGEQAPEVLPEVVRVGEDHDAPRGRYGGTDSDSGDEPTDQNGDEGRAEPHQQQPDDVDADAEQYDVSRMATVGERGDQHLRQERRDEAETDDEADRGFADAVLVAVVVDDREQDAVARSQTGHQAAEREEQRVRRRRLSSGGRRHVGR